MPFEVSVDIENTPLLLASSQGLVNVVDRLLEADASVDIMNDNGDTPLIWVCYKGHNGVVGSLLRAKVDIDILNHHGDNPLIYFFGVSGWLTEEIDISNKRGP